MNSPTAWGSYQYFGGPAPAVFRHIPTEEIWQWVDYGTMVDDGIHPWNPDFRYLLAGIVLADLAKYGMPQFQQQLLMLAARQIEQSAKGIVGEISVFADALASVMASPSHGAPSASRFSPNSGPDPAR